MATDIVGDRELARLSWRYRDLIQRFRLDWFRERLAGGQAAGVLRNQCGFTDDRWTIWFRDGSALRLKLYYQVRADITNVLSMRWVERDGWRVRVRSISGETLELHAYRAVFHPSKGVVV